MPAAASAASTAAIQASFHMRRKKLYGEPVKANRALFLVHVAYNL
jgi:hypothetical protein